MFKKRVLTPFFKTITNEEELKRNWKPEDVEIEKFDYDPKDEEERLNRLRERVDEHQNTLSLFQRLFQGKGWRVGTGNFDLLSEKDTNVLLVEVKTLKEKDVSDERLRIIDGIGKLLFYEEFDVPRLLINKQASVHKVMVFSKTPNNEEHVRFLAKLGIWVVWFDNNGKLVGESEAILAIQCLLDT